MFGIEGNTDNGQSRRLLGLGLLCKLLQLSFDHFQPAGDLISAIGPFLLPRDEERFHAGFFIAVVLQIAV